MKEKHVEQEIYLYRELSELERKTVNTHLSDCESCKALFVMVQKNEAMISKMAFTKPEPEHRARLTNKIMEAVQVREKETWFTMSFIRYGMAATSFVLILTFGVEFLSAAKSPYKRVPGNNQVTLNSTSLTKAALDRRNNTDSSKPSLYACAKTEVCNHPIIENFKKKTF